MYEEDESEDDTLSAGGRPSAVTQDVEVPRADVEVEGASHVLHETRTDVATRGLFRDLADDPSAALTFWEKMAKAGGSKPPEWMSTHPSDQTRIDEIRKQLPAAMAIYKARYGNTAQ